MIKLKNLLLEELEINTFQMYHGGKKWYTTGEINPIKQGRYEHGVGIYLTNNYETARRYAKGSRVVSLININKNFTDINKVSLDTTEMFNFLMGVNRLKNKNGLISDLKSYIERNNTNIITADILNNLVVNNESGAGQGGVEITKFLVSKGVDASLVYQSGKEYWLVVFNPKIIISYKYVDPKTINNSNYILSLTINK
jgi:hypothetical protein